MTTLNFALTRAVGRTLRAGDEILVTRLDHDGNVSPWLELAHDLGARSSLRRAHGRHDARLRRPRAEAHRPHACRRVPPRVERGRHARPTRAGSSSSRTASGRSRGSTQCTTARTVRSTSRDLGVDVLLCSPYKFFGPHLGLASVRAELAERWRTYKVRPRCDHRSRPARSRTSCSPASSRPSSTSSRSAGRRSRRTSARSGSGSSTASRTGARSTACRRWRGACRRSPSTSRVAAARGRGERSREREIAVWDGDYYAVEVMRRLGLGDARRRACRLRPLQHRGRGRPAARSALTRIDALRYVVGRRADRP